MQSTKKLSLNAAAFQKGEVLTRSQLKKVLGGNGSGNTGSSVLCATSCTCPSGYHLKPGVTTFYATVSCNGNCIAIDGVSVTCGTTLVSCSTSSIYDGFCDKDPIV